MPDLNSNFYSRFLQSVERWPQRTALEMQRAPAPSGSIPPIESCTYAELRRRAESVAAWLDSTWSGFQSTSPPAELHPHAAIFAANSPEWVMAYLGVLAAGGVAIPLDTALKPPQLATLLRDSDSSILFTDPRNLAAAESAVADSALPIRIVLLNGLLHGSGATPHPTLQHICSAPPAAFTRPPSSPDDLAVILYTSGTTSDPKGVMLTHANLLAEADAVFHVIKLSPEDSILGILPLFHALAQMANLMLPFAAGMRVVYLESLNTTELLRGLRERQITIFCCVPQFFYLIHEKIMKQVKQRGLVARLAFRALLSLSSAGRKLGLNPGKLFFAEVHRNLGPSLRYMITGGSRFDTAIGDDLQSLGFHILQAYGLTETTGGACVTPPRHNVVGSVGQPLKGVTVKIGDKISEKTGDNIGAGIDRASASTFGSHAVSGGPDSHFAAASDSHDPDSPEPISGEVLIQGAIVMAGYYNRPDATAEVLRDGWLHTGDLGRLDDHGNLFITGRQKDVIVLSSGKNIYPEELEAHYLQSQFIKELCVVGLESQPGQPFSERLHALVVPDFDLLREKRIVNINEVVRFDVESLSAQLPSTKRILSYDIYQSELPRTTTRKLKRFEILKIVEQRQQNSNGSGSNDQPSSNGRPSSAIASASAASAASALSDSALLENAEDAIAWLALPDVQRAVAVVKHAAKTDVPDVLPHHNLELDLGLDSMERVELLVALERELSTHVEDSVVSEVYTVRELIDAVRNADNAPANISTAANINGAANMNAATASSTTAAPSGIAAASTPARARSSFTGWESVFATESDDPDVNFIADPRPISAAAWYLFGNFVSLLARDVFRARVTGLEKLPRSGPFILCPNHQSFLDGPIVASMIPWRIYKDLFFVGTSEIFGSGFMRKLSRSFNLIPVDPDANLVPAMRAGAYGLKRGKVLVLYPEGERSIDGNPKSFKKGAAILAIHLQVPIYPVAIDGFHDAWPRGQSLPTLRNINLRLRFGDPILPPPRSAASEAAYAKLTADLRNSVVTMWEAIHHRS